MRYFGAFWAFWEHFGIEKSWSWHFRGERKLEKVGVGLPAKSGSWKKLELGFQRREEVGISWSWLFGSDFRVNYGVGSIFSDP